MALRRRAAESLGLLAKRSGDQKQRDRIAKELEGWLRSDALDLRIDVQFDPSKRDPAMVRELVEETQRQVAEVMLHALESGQLPGGLKEEDLEELFQVALQQQLKQRLQELPQQIWAAGQSPGWAEHDARLPLLQGAAQGLQLASSIDLPPLGSGPGRVVPMLSVTALDEDGGLRIRTDVIDVPVWKLLLPNDEQLELVLVREGEYTLGSPVDEQSRNAYTQFRQKCEGINVEALRRVRLGSFAMVRHPITQAQWRSVVETLEEEQRGSLNPEPGTFWSEDSWERHAQPGALPVDSVSWTDCRQWLEALNAWLVSQWPSWKEQHPNMGAQTVQFELPSESQWEAACRGGVASPFHFGDTLDSTWARYDATHAYGKGRRGSYQQRPVSVGSFGLVNRLGMAELHGQLQEWCADRWQRDPVKRSFGDGSALEEVDPGLAGAPMEREMRLLRGGSWFYSALNARAAFRFSDHPDAGTAYVGIRPCCLLPTGLFIRPLFT